MKDRLEELQRRIKWEEKVYKERKRHSLSLLILGIIVAVFICTVGHDSVTTWDAVSISLLVVLVHEQAQEFFVYIPRQKMGIDLLKMEEKHLLEIVEKR